MVYAYPDKGYCVTTYEDGTRLHSQKFSIDTGYSYGYPGTKEEATKLVQWHHDVLHLWLADRLGYGTSLNHWLVAHKLDNEDTRLIRESEEDLVTGVMLLFFPERVPVQLSWGTARNNDPNYYRQYAVRALGVLTNTIVHHAREFLFHEIYALAR